MLRQSAEQLPASLPAKSAVWRLSWSSRSSAHLLSPALLRDLHVSEPFPAPLRHASVNLFEYVPLEVQLVSLEPPATAHTVVEGAETTQTYLLPALPPSLRPHSLLPLPEAAYVAGAHIPSLLRLALSHTHVRDTALQPPKSLLVHGPYGSGKTSALAHAAHLSCATLIHLTSSFLHTHALSPAATLQTLRHFIDAAVASAPALILLDDIHFVFPPDDTAAAAALIQALDAVHAAPAPIAIALVAAPGPETVHASVRGAVHLQASLALSVDSALGTSLAQRHAPKVPPSVLAERLPSARLHTPAAVVDWARSLAVSYDASDAATQSVPTGSDESVPPQAPLAPPAHRPPAWASLSASVGGLRTPQRLLQRALLWPVTRKATQARLSLPPATATLLYGPPGTGKTALVRAAATATSRTLHPIDAAALARGQVGASERLLCEAFEAAYAARPAILFFDEVDALLTAGDAPHAKRLASVMAYLLDDACDDVAVVAATNRPWAVARPLLRAGRFDTRIHVPLPTPEERADIARVLVDGRWAQCVCEQLVRLAGSDVAQGFSGADLAGVTRRAGLAASARGAAVTEDDLDSAFKSTVPSVDAKQAERIAAWR